MGFSGEEVCLCSIAWHAEKENGYHQRDHHKDMAKLIQKLGGLSRR